MHNLVYLIGRLSDDPKTKDIGDGKTICNIKLAVQRSYKNEEGIYDVDYINCVLFDGIANKTCEYCKKGDLVGIKGRIQESDYEKNNDKDNAIEIVADKVSFLATKKEDEMER